MIQIESKLNDKTQGNITTPIGWEMTEGKIDPADIIEQQKTDILKKKIESQFPSIADNVEGFIDKMLDRFNILVSKAYISINAEATFFITLLINKDDYFSPTLFAAKINADEQLTTLGNMSMRYKFIIQEDYFQYYYAAQQDDKLKYSFRNPLIDAM